MATLTTLTSEVIRLLNEATNSSVGEVGDGSGTVTTTTNQTIEVYLNEAIKETMGCTFATLINADVPLTIVNKSD